MNIIKLLLVAFAVHITLIFLGIADIPGSSLYQFLIDPSIWDSSGFLSGLIGDITALVGAGLIVAGTIVTRSDIFLFAGLTAVLISFGLPLAELFTIVAAQSNTILATLLVSPIILIYVMTCVAFWRGSA